MRTSFCVLGAALLLAACGGNGNGNGDSGPGTVDDSGPGTVTDGQTQNPDDSGTQPISDSGVTSDGPLPDGSVVIDTDAGPVVCYQTTCNGKLLQCGNCTDDDGDGRIDSEDHECLGPCDNTEGPTLNADVGGETGATCGADCYWDFGNGAGNDACAWDYRCDPFAPKDGCAFDQSRVGTSTCADPQPQMCQDFCGPLTPNGCDCFGCCTFPELAGQGPNGEDGYVWIGHVTNGGTGTCTFADVQDPAKCPSCTPQLSCFNDCKTCELCIGKPELPPECYDTGDPSDPDAGTPPPPQECPDGLQACGLEGQDPCPQGFYCISGCCREAIL